MKTQQAQLLPSIANLARESKKENCELQHLCSNLSDEEVVAKVKQDKECLACLLERYDWKMRTYVKRITGLPSETVEDIVQEVFLKVYLNIDKFDPKLKFSSWLYRIAHNQAVNVYLREKRRKTENIITMEGNEAYFILKDNHDIWQKIQQENLNEKMNNAIGKISKQYQDVIELNYFHEKSYQEISTELGKPVNTIGTLLNRGRKILKKELIEMGVICDVAMVQMEKA